MVPIEAAGYRAHLLPVIEQPTERLYMHGTSLHKRVCHSAY